MMTGCLAPAQSLLQVRENAESDSRAQHGEKGYGEPHKGEQCVFHQSPLSPKPSETISRLDMMTSIVKAITITSESTSPRSYVQAFEAHHLDVFVKGESR